MRQIHVRYINKIKTCLGRIFSAEDGWEDYPNRVIAQNNRAIEHYLTKSNVTTKEERKEFFDCVDWCWDGCVERLEALGWTILVGKENL